MSNASYQMIRITGCLRVRFKVKRVDAAEKNSECIDPSFSVDLCYKKEGFDVILLKVLAAPFSSGDVKQRVLIQRDRQISIT